ncbi:MAG: 50S ribosomal protein L25/general stress protein Ctc [Pseudomonadota bacterium]
MAGEIPDLHATVRAGTGKGAARQARRDGQVPGIVFGGDTDPVAINIPFNVLLKKLKAGRFKSTLFNLKLEGHDDVRIICRDVQRDVVKDLPTHVDFMRLRRTTKINLFIPVEIIGEDDSQALRRGGNLNLVRPEIELVVTAADIPEAVHIDISEMEIGDTVTISMVTLPEGAKPTIDRDFVIATMDAPKGIGGGDDEDGEEGEAAEGGEE